MKKHTYLSHVKSIASAVFLTCIAGSNVLFADDTEVFFGSQTTQSTSYPNVLFVFDTSGSMGGTDGTGISRIDRMKTAVETILDTATNINVGMMRFNGTYGGSSVIYPVTYIDKELCPNGVCVGADPSVQLEVRVNSSDGDATENTSSLDVITNDPVLQMFENSSIPTTETKTYQLADNNGDVEQSPTNDRYVSSSVDMDGFFDTYNWTYGGLTHYGLHFPNIDIDPGSTILSAKVSQELNPSGSGVVGANIYAHDIADSPSFADQNGRRINNRVRTSEVVNWPSIPFYSSGQAIDTPDISSLIASRVNDPSWQSGNNISIIFEPDLTVSTPSNSNYRQFRSRNGGSSATELEVTYGSSGSLQKLGVRFDDLRIPQGATITSASLEFVSHDSNSSPTTATISGHDADDSSVFTTSNGNISSRSLTSANVSWTPTNWDLNATQSLGEKYQTTDISTVVQEIVDRSGWCGGNALSLILDGTGLREAVSFDQTASQAPLLKVNYDATSIPSSGGCTVADAQASIASGSDDTEENLSSGSITTTSTDLEMPYDGSNNQLVGLRFRDLLIPRNATITSASLTFEVDESPSGSSSIFIQADANPTPSVLSSTRYDLSNRTRTSSTVNWNSVPSSAVNEKVTTPDVTPIVQEIVDKSAWSSGGDMVFLFSRKSGSGTRKYESYNGEAAVAPSLKVSYRVTGAAASSGTAQITYQTTREKLKTSLDDMMIRGGTPIVASLYEAAQYYKGGPVYYGQKRGRYYTHRYNRVSHPLSYTGGSLNTPSGCDNDNDPNNSSCTYEEIAGSAQYITPINDSCQSNHVVLLSDGAPSSEQSSVENSIESMIDSSCSNSYGSSQKCGIELLSYLKDNDQSTVISGTQDITTYTIGFNFTSQWMKDLATAGGGSFYEADSSSTLVDAFNKILGEILKVDTSFVSPGATVNQFNRLTHRNDIYFSLFKPSEKPTWQGNLKQYLLAGDPAQIVDANGDPAVDEATGYFKDTAQSVWSDVVDGSTVDLGGAANEITLSNRNVYTYTGGQADLTNANNRFHETNSSLSKAMLNVSGQTDSYASNLVKWARGVDVNDEDGDGSNTDVRNHMGDPMHSRPLIINYSDTDSVIFVATNEGFLHVIDSDDGSEVYSFIPNELLPNLDLFYTNSSAIDHPYGLDGDITTWTDETTGKIYLYVGMRRGGNKYYALDITNKLTPKLEWIIDGDTNSDFSSLGQTWSKPTPTKINFGGSERNVLIFAGGYDTNQDTATTTSVDSTGNAIYIVDAKTGSLIWSGGDSGSGATKTFPDMDYSIPSDMSLIDIDSDGYTDQLYVGDMGGQVWRFDLDSSSSSATNLVEGGVMAKLSDTDTSSARKFYYAPDISILNNLGTSSLAISIGSGWRAHPLDTTIEDRFYMFRSEDIYAAPAGYGIQNGSSSIYRPITESDLVNVTDNLNADMSTGYGWMLEMESTGEKVLAKSVTVNNQVLFTTYRPEEAASACAAALGGGALYVVDLYDGSPSSNLDEQGTDENLTKTDRVTALTHGGIPPEAIILFPTDADNSAAIDPIILVATEQVDLDLGLGTKRTFWQTPE